MTEQEATMAALNYAIGYIEAVAGWATLSGQRDSAKKALENIDAVMVAAARPARTSGGVAIGASKKNNPVQRFMQEAVVRALMHKSDAEVVAFAAATLLGADDPLSEYMAQRLERIPVLLEAEEAGGR